MTESTDKNIPDYNYDAIMSIKKGKYYLYIRELQMLGCGDDINSAYSDLTSKKQQLIREFQEGENLNELPIPAKKATPSLGNDFREIRLFLFKLGIVAILGLLVFSFANGVLSNSIDPFTQAIKDKIRVSKFGNFLLVQLEDAIEHDITPEMEKRIINDIRILVKRLQPYTNELKPLLKPTEKSINNLSVAPPPINNQEQP